MSLRFTRNLSSMAVLAGLAIAALGHPRDAAAQAARTGPSGHVRMGGMFHENFFQLPSDVPRQDVWARFVEVTFEDPVEPDGASRIFLRVDLMQFASMGISPGASLGFRLDDETHSFNVTGTYEWNRPRLEIGDAVTPANVAGLGATYSYRGIPDFQITGMGRYYRDWLRDQPSNGRFDEIGGAVRYRGFGRAISPEVGYALGRRLTAIEGDEYEERTWFVTLRSSGVPRTYVTTRYRHRLREYTNVLPGSRNTGRVDRRHQVTTSVDVNLSQSLVWNFSLRFERALASRADRSFTTLAMGSGITMLF
jgi:hypothetical protein